jgi:carboxypeptidase PM20D1
VLDEGLNIFNGIIDGVSAPVALIGIAEKGYLSLQLIAASPVVIAPRHPRIQRLA